MKKRLLTLLALCLLATSCNGVTRTVRVTVTGEITTSDTNGILPMDDGLPPFIFLTPTDYTDSDPEIEKFAKPIAKVLAGEGALAAGHALMAAVAEAVNYEGGTTNVTTTAAEALAAGKGVYLADSEEAAFGTCENVRRFQLRPDRFSQILQVIANFHERQWPQHQAFAFSLAFPNLHELQAGPAKVSDDALRLMKARLDSQSGKPGFIFA